MGCVLPKTHKLCLPSAKTSGEKVLAQVEQLQCQLQSLKDHMIAHDIYDVMTVVMPEDVMSSPKLLPEKYQIFDDHLRMHPVHVANSNCWHDLWVDQPCSRENVAYVLGLLQHNADEELWSACRDEHDEYDTCPSLRLDSLPANSLQVLRCHTTASF